jgi:hypothetical protein
VTPAGYTTLAATCGVAAVLLGIAAYLLWRAGRTASEALTLGLGVVSLMATIYFGVQAHQDSVASKPPMLSPSSNNKIGSTNTKPRTEPAPRTTKPDPAATSLPAHSSLRNKILGIDEYCGLPEGTYAWLPGQKSAKDITGRRIHAVGAVYTWSCTQDSRKLTRDDMSNACLLFYPNTRAYYFDYDDADFMGMHLTYDLQPESVHDRLSRPPNPQVVGVVVSATSTAIPQVEP